MFKDMVMWFICNYLNKLKTILIAMFSIDIDLAIVIYYFDA